jgi:uncharacterized iron-regulated membrane protein
MHVRAGLARRASVWLHRWVGLAMTAFLVIVGLTGSVLAFNTELERICAPQLFAAARPGQVRLDLATLAERTQALVPQARLQGISMTEPDQASAWFVARTDAATGRPVDIGFTEFFVDPWTGAELGRRKRGDLSEGMVNLMPFIYELHWTLVLGDAGQWALGIVAIAWTIDCLIAFYLTLPTTRKAFWSRWKRAWRVKRGASTYRLNFDLHRAGGLWVWPLLFVFAWSSVMMNIRPAYEAVMVRLFDYQSSIDSFMAGARPGAAPRLDWHAAQAVGERLITEQGAMHGFTAGERLSLVYFVENGAYLYEVRGSRDIFERAPKGGGTSVMFDGDSGALRELSQPTGERTGNTIESWLYALHMARVFGRPYQIFVCLLGLVVAMLGVTGVYIWLRKRRAQIVSRRRVLHDRAAIRGQPVSRRGL